MGIVLCSHKPSASAPPAETIVRTAKGTATSVGASLSKTGVTIAAGSYLFVVLGYTANQDITFDSASITDGEIDTPLSAVAFDVLREEMQIAGGSSVFLLYAYFANALTGTLNVSFIENGQGAEGALSCVILTQVEGLAASAALDKMPASSGSGASPSSGASAVTALAHEFVIGVVGTGGPVGDNAGTWTAPLEAGQRIGVGTGLGGSAVTISEGFYIQTAAAARTAAKTGITSRYWVAGCATFKAAA